MTTAAPEILTLRNPDHENLIGQTDEQTGRRHLSHSALGTLLACERRWGWRYDERLERIEQAKPLALGKAFHYALEHNDPQTGADQLDRQTYDQADEDRLLIDKAIVRNAAALYLRLWESESHREVGYRIRLRSPYTGAYSRTFDLLGYADGVTDHGDYLELHEDKLRGTIDTQSVRRVRLDRQVALEAYALWRITGKPVRAIRYRFIRKPSIKQKQNESIDSYLARLEQDYIERGEDFYSHQEQTYRSSDDLLLTEQELWRWSERLREAHRSKFYARNTDRCGDFGQCPFLELCLGDPDARALYRVKTDPVEEEQPA